jgi:TetR/AcrR family transcriptional regulator, transcriptional repressor for nem operon
METQTTREHLIEVGLERIRSNGYSGTGVKEILDLANVPKGSFYHYFPSKESFVLEVFQRYTNEEMLRAERILGDRTIAPLQRLRTYFEELVTVYGQRAAISGCLIGSLSLEVADHNQKLQQQLKGSFSHWQQGLTSVLQEAVDRGDLPSSYQPGELAGFLITSYEGALVRMKADQSDKPLETFLHFTFDVLLKPQL